MDCKLTANKARCSCPWTDCSNHGACCQCLSSHLGKKQLPHCCYPNDAAAQDRSFAGFAKAWDLVK